MTKHKFLILATTGLFVLSACTPKIAQAPGVTSDQTKTDRPAAEVKPTSPLPPHPLSLPAYAEREFIGKDLELGAVLSQTDAYTRHYITYRSEGLKISGIMNIPHGQGPFPVLFLNHGFIDPAVYTNGRGLKREQDFLARQGYVVLHSDYRNHADSDKDDNAEINFRLGYTADVINAVNAVKASDDPRFDKNKLGMLGHSMGGGVAQNIMVTKPGLVDAYVLYAPVSSDYVDSYKKWVERRSDVAAEIVRRYGVPNAALKFWANLSPINFFDYVSEPVQIYHGTADDSVPLDWSIRSRDALRAEDKAVELIIYEGAPHEFIKDFQPFMRGVTKFFDEHLK